MKFQLILPLEYSLTISKIYNLFTFECFFNDFLYKENSVGLLAEPQQNARLIRHCYFGKNVLL